MCLVLSSVTLEQSLTQVTWNVFVQFVKTMYDSHVTNLLRQIFYVKSFVRDLADSVEIELSSVVTGKSIEILLS